MLPDPVATAAVTAAITKTAGWLWDKYGQSVVEKLGKKGLDQAKWQLSVRRYLPSLYDEVSWLRVLGKPEGQPIERMYTDVNVLDKITAQRWYDIQQLEAEYTLRGYLRWQKEERRDGLALARQTQRLFILGKPGAGKTTFLKHVALQTIKGGMGEKVPIFVTLKSLSDSGQAIVPYIVEQFRIHEFPEADPFVHRLLRDGRSVVLFDGLDEVNLEGNRRTELIEALKNFVREFGDNQIFITCRIAASDYTFERFTYVEIADFSSDQIRTFVYRWFQNDKTRRDNCWRALRDTQNQTLHELAQIPLLLSLLCLVFEERNEFPRELVEIYKQATEALLVKWDASRNIARDSLYQELTLKHKQKMLAHIAAQTFDAGEYFLKEGRLEKLIGAYLRGVPGLTEVEPDAVAVLKDVEAQHGIFVERARRIHSFSHLTLQEYYTARYIVENEARGTLPRLMQKMGGDRWREVFLLTASMLDDATEFCQLYLAALAQRMAEDETATGMLQWSADKSECLRSRVKPSAARAFILYLVLDLSYALPYSLALTLALTLDRALVSDRARVLNLALTRDRTFARDLALTRARALALDLTLTYDLALMHQIPDSIGAILEQVKDWSWRFNLVTLRNQLTQLTVPANEAPARAWSEFNNQLFDMILAHWGLNTSWELSNRQDNLLYSCLEANWLLVECLGVAYVPDRAMIEDQLLLPPENVKATGTQKHSAA